jgi:hypothetical protein
MRLPVRPQHVLGPQERTVRFRIFCPRQRRSVDFEECSACPRMSTVPATPGEPGACIDCAPHDAASEVKLPAPLDPRSLAGRDEPVGALAGPRVLCVHAELPVDLLPVAFREWSGVEIAVVDGLGHLIGTVWRDDFVRPKKVAELHASAEPRVADLVDQPTRIHEGSTIGQAVEVLAIRRARTLILVQDDDIVVGALTDLELLRWLTHERRRLSEVRP